MPSTTPYGFEFESVSEQPGRTLHGGLSGTEPILAEQVNDELERLESEHSGRLDVLEARPLPGWEELDSGLVTSVTHQDITGIGGFSHYRLLMRGTLDTAGTDDAWIILQVNPGDPTTTNQGAQARRVSDNTVTDQFHSSTAETWRIGRWSNAVGCNAVIDIFNTVPDGPNLISHLSHAARVSGTNTLHKISESWGRINSTRTLSTLRMSRLSPSSAFATIHWKLLGSP